MVEEIAPGCTDSVLMSLYEGARPEQLRGADAKTAEAAV
jgi:hypothetical protein